MIKLTPWTIVDCTINPDTPDDEPAGHLRCKFPTTDIQNNYLKHTRHQCACTGALQLEWTLNLLPLPFLILVLLLEYNLVTAAVAFVVSFPRSTRISTFYAKGKHFPRHMVDTSLHAIAYNACAVSIS